MNKLNVAVAAIGGMIVLCATPSRAGIAYTGLGIDQFYTQTTSGIAFDSSLLGGAIDTFGPTDFTSITVTAPSGASIPVSMTAVPEPDGTFQDTFLSASIPGADAATSLAALNATYPFGTYTITATGGTSAPQTATLTYDTNHLPTVPGSSANAAPALTSASYTAIQGMNSSLSQTLNFNNFTADGIPPPGSGYVTPYTYVIISNASTGATVFSTPFGTTGSLSSSATSLLLPANTLQPGTNYSYTIGFDNLVYCGTLVSCGPAGNPPFVLGFSAVTSGTFTTLAAAPAGTTVVNVAGGTLANPMRLVSEGQTGQVDGSIGGDGAEDFYEFYWAGGTFDANAQLYGADPSGQYEFELLNRFGTLLDEVTLDAADGFAADLSYALGAGADYEIGLVADSTFDPAYSITFETPVTGVPEPGTLALFGLGLVSLVLIRRRLAR